MAEASEARDRVRSHFGPLERRGVLAGWRGGQIAAVAAGLVVAVGALRADPGIAGAAVAVVAVAGAGATASWPIAGRTAEQWLPLVARRAADLARGTTYVASPAPAGGGILVATGDGLACADPAHRARPARPSVAGWWRATGRGEGAGPFAGVRIVADGPTSALPGCGVVIDERAGTATAALVVRGHNFALLGAADQDRRVVAWSRVLAGLARQGGEVHRVQWLESCLPDAGDAVRAYATAHAALEEGNPARRSYQTLLDSVAAGTRRHRVLVSLTVRTRARTGRKGRPPGPGDGAIGPGLPEVPGSLGREAADLCRALRAADVVVDGVLGPSALAAVIRESFEADMPGPVRPDGAADGTAAGAGSAAAVGAGPAGSPGAPPGVTWPWPMGVDTAWDAVRADALWHAVYWIAEWPRIDVTPDFLGPLLFLPARRTLAVTMEPVPPVEAARQVARDRTADLADGELRRRGGFLVTARQQREREGAERRDAELADGHAQFRFTGYLSVAAPDREALADACMAAEQAAAQARLELRRLYGDQDRALACVLPLGRGLS
ncbi:MAG: hypothetical protein M0013_15330 [Actinomycetota bacterium]|nr:hypothetical protein [Actinomycetota bacterium]